MWLLLLNFTRSWNFGIFRVYWVLKSKCIISRNLRAQGSRDKVLTFAVFVESMVHSWHWPSRESETVGNSWKQSETVGNSRKQSGAARQDHVKIVNPPFFLTKKTVRAKPIFFDEFNGKQLETVGACTFDSAKKGLFRTSLWRTWT